MIISWTRRKTHDFICFGVAVLLFCHVLLPTSLAFQRQLAPPTRKGRNSWKQRKMPKTHAITEEQGHIRPSSSLLMKNEGRTTSSDTKPLLASTSTTSSTLTAGSRRSTTLSRLFSTASTSNESPETQRQRFLWRIVKVFLAPLRVVLWPFRWMVKLGIEDLVDDDTATLEEKKSKDSDASSTVPAPVHTESLEESIGDVGLLEPSSTVTTSLESMALVDSTPYFARKVVKVAQPAATAEAAVPIVTVVDKPVGSRWAIAAPDVDLTGDWELIVTDEFKSQYDKYLAGLGQPYIVRSVAVNIVWQTTEKVVQSDHGRSLLIRGKNIRGVWDRTLIASGSDLHSGEYTPQLIPVMTADSEQVEAESWWEKDGRVHVSWLRGVEKYGGGAFESKRYMDDNGEYICESTWHSKDTKKEPVSLTFRFRRREEEHSDSS